MEQLPRRCGRFFQYRNSSGGITTMGPVDDLDLYNRLMIQHRILYQVVENGTTTGGVTTCLEDVREHLVILRKRFRDATYIYCELQDEYDDGVIEDEL